MPKPRLFRSSSCLSGWCSFAAARVGDKRRGSKGHWNAVALIASVLAIVPIGATQTAQAQSFGISNLNFAGQGSVSSSTSLTFGPDGRLYVLQLNGTIDILTIQRNGVDDYVVTAAEELLDVKNIPNHNDDGSSHGGTSREAIGIAVTGTATNPIIYATSSDSRVGGPSGDKDLDTNSGVLTRLSWIGSDINDPQGYWEVVDLVRGLPRSEENHATNGLDPVTIGGEDYLIVASGGHTNAGSPSTNFAWHTEYALAAAVLAVNLTQLEALPIVNDGVRDYVYDLPTVDDPTRANANGIDDPNDPGYDGVDTNDPWGGNDGLNQAKLVPGGPVQIFSPGYRNAYDLVVTEGGAVYVTDNGANGGWGGLPEAEGPGGSVTNNYRPGEPGSSSPDGGEQVNNEDHLHLVTNDITTYSFGSFYGGHPAPIRANPAGAGLFTRGSHSSDPGDSNGNTYLDDWFRTIPYDPNGTGDAADPTRALPADWPPVPLALANPVEGDFRNPGELNPDGPDDEIITTWDNNTNGIDEYTASNFGGAMKGDLIAGKSGGALHRVQVDPSDGSLVALTQNFVSNLGGNPLGITANGDADPFPGTIWVGTFNSDIVVLEPQDFVICILPGETGYDPLGDNDSDGYTNQDEEDNGTDLCNGGSQPGDFDKQAGGPLVSDLNDPDDDADGIDDAVDPLQLGDPTNTGSDAFALPVINELFSDNLILGGYLGLGLTGMMNNGAPNPNWLNWLDETDAGPNPNDILGGAVGAMTMQMTSGTAVGASNDQEKGFQYGVLVDLTTGGFRVEGRLLNFDQPLQLYDFAGPAELGVFMGDGTQSNFVQITVDADGVKVLHEVADTWNVELSGTIAVADRPTGSMTFRLDVDSATGEVFASYAIDGGTFVSLGSFTAQGTLLDAIQQAGNVLTVGLIGTSNTPGAEVEGTWDYLNVVGRQPSVEAPIPDLEVPVGGAASQDIDLSAYFDDDEGDANLTYTVVSETDPTIGTSIVGNILTLTFPAAVATSTITVRATDGSGLFLEQSFTVSVTNPVAIFRVNAGGPELFATDGGINWSAGNAGLVTSASDYSTSSAITWSGTEPTELFQTEAWDPPSGTEMLWQIPVPDGDYELRLYFAEIYTGTFATGARVFDVLVEGAPVLVNYDIYAEVGPNTGVVESFLVSVNDGAIDVEFLHVTENPKISGIEIISGAGAPPGDTPIVVASIPNQVSSEGEVIFVPVLASGGDTPDVFSYSATGLPPGLQIEPTTGLIYGTIAAGAFSGSPYAVSVTVDDADADPSDTVTETFTWTISDPSQILWIDLNEDENYTGRHECSFVQAGDKFYLFGGRENAETLDTYDWATDTWATSASAPKPFNHFQATEYQGLVWVVGAFQDNNFPDEEPADFIWVFDPANDAWTQGPAIPEVRQRGGAGLVVYNDKFYMVGGNTTGHNGGYVPWFDEFDPVAGSFTALADAPRARDHFHAKAYNNKLYLIGGRLSGGPGGTFAPLIPEVDVYDFATATWSSLPSTSDLPTPRAASAMAIFNDRIFVIGGEGNGQAYDTVESLDPTTGSWETTASLNYPRHGTQAIVSGAGIYVVAGSPNQGGGNQKNMEVYGADQPAGTPNTPGQLTLSLSGDLNGSGPSYVYLDHTGGNQAIYVSDVAITGPDAADFAIVTPLPTAFLLGVGQSLQVELSYQGTSATPSANVEVTASGTVTSIPLAACSSDASCDDGVVCNGVETCGVDGFCDPGVAVNCDDGVACTVDSCNESLGVCDNIANASLCDNGLFCDGAESCDVVAGCQPGTPVTCASGEVCDELSDACVPDGGGSGCSVDADCDDGLVCNGVETCVGGVCNPGVAVNCDDGVACTVDSCNESLGVCDNIANASLCDNGLFCDGAESCDVVAGCQPGTPVTCASGEVCDELSDACVPDGGDGTILHRVNAGGAEVASTDAGPPWLGGNPGLVTSAASYSTSASSTPVGGEPAALYQSEVWDSPSLPEMLWAFPVPDGDYELRLYFAEIYSGAFAVGARVFDVLVEGTPVLVDYDIYAEVGPNTGVVKSFLVSVNDGAIDVEFLHVTENPKISAIEVAAYGPECSVDEDCDDGLVCNGVETCVGGVCNPGVAVNCDDGVACTVDSCNESLGVCDNIANASLCDNGLFCDGAESCDVVAGCQPGTPVTCASGEVCDELSDACVPDGGGSGCSVDADCDDGLVCNGVETCVGGVCNPGVAVNCDDGVACTVDSCNESLGVCDNIANASLCDNGLFCDGAESCDVVAGCLPGTPISCGIDEFCDESVDACRPVVLHRVNAGGPTLPSPDGLDWVSGVLPPGASDYSTSASIAWSESAPSPELFQTEAWDPPQGAEMLWEFPLPAGDYELRLYFAEIWSGAFADGERVFNVLVEGTPALVNYDIHSIAGPNTGIVEVVPTTVADGALSVEFIHVIENPKVSGFEIVAR